MSYHRYFQFFRFVVVGALSYGLSVAFLLVLTEVFFIHYLFATIAVFLTVNGVSFWLNKRYTFLLTHGVFQGELLRYYGVMAMSLFLNLLGMYILVSLMHASVLAASILVAGILLCFNYFFHKTFTFRLE